MDVIEVIISQMRTEPGVQRVSGIVSLLTRGSHIVVHCDTALPNPKRKRAVLLSEALRQLARMPEYSDQPHPLQCRLIAAGPDA